MLTELQSRLKAKVWQAVAQSGVNVSAVPQPEMDKLVQAIADGVLHEVNDILGQTADKPNLPAADDDTEEVLWEGRPFMSFSSFYQITSERVRIVEGLFGKERRDIELIRIKDIDHKQNLAERTFNIGDVFIASHDFNDANVVLRNVSNPDEVHEILRRAMLKARKKYNVGLREEM